MDARRCITQQTQDDQWTHGGERRMTNGRTTQLTQDDPIPKHRRRNRINLEFMCRKKEPNCVLDANEQEDSGKEEDLQAHRGKVCKRGASACGVRPLQQNSHCPSREGLDRRTRACQGKERQSQSRQGRCRFLHRSTVSSCMHSRRQEFCVGSEGQSGDVQARTPSLDELCASVISSMAAVIGAQTQLFGYLC